MYFFPHTIKSQWAQILCFEKNMLQKTKKTCYKKQKKHVTKNKKNMLQHILCSAEENKLNGFGTA